MGKSSFTLLGSQVYDFGSICHGWDASSHSPLGAAPVEEVLHARLLTPITGSVPETLSFDLRQTY